MGPSGSGKSAVGALLAARLGAEFVDGDDLHPAANVAKMSAGTPLDDADRMPWLDRIAARLTGSDDIVLACSALARRYRQRILDGAPDARFLELRVSREELLRRMSARSHFMPPALLASQLATLEHLTADEPGAVLPADQPLDEVVAAAERAAQSLR
jgi:gluconokinase